MRHRVGAWWCMFEMFNVTWSWVPIGCPWRLLMTSQPKLAKISQKRSEHRYARMISHDTLWYCNILHDMPEIVWIRVTCHIFVCLWQSAEIVLCWCHCWIFHSRWWWYMMILLEFNNVAICHYFQFSSVLYPLTFHPFWPHQSDPASLSIMPLSFWRNRCSRLLLLMWGQLGQL